MHEYRMENRRDRKSEGERQSQDMVHKWGGMGYQWPQVISTQYLAYFKTKETTKTKTDYSANATFLLSNAVSIRREQFFSRQKHTAGLFIRPWEKQRKGTEYRTSAYLIFVISFTQTGFSKTKTPKKTTKITKNTKNVSEKVIYMHFFHSFWKNLHLTENGVLVRCQQFP